MTPGRSPGNRSPLEHDNNLGWTALIESIVPGDGGPHYIDTLRALVEAGANVNLADHGGQTPLTIARRRGCGEKAKILEGAGARSHPESVRKGRSNG